MIQVAYRKSQRWQKCIFRGLICAWKPVPKCNVWRLPRMVCGFKPAFTGVLHGGTVRVSTANLRYTPESGVGRWWVWGKWGDEKEEPLRNKPLSGCIQHATATFVCLYNVSWQVCVCTGCSQERYPERQAWLLVRASTGGEVLEWCGRHNDQRPWNAAHQVSCCHGNLLVDYCCMFDLMFLITVYGWQDMPVSTLPWYLHILINEVWIFGLGFAFKIRID